jgi:hypothetical protein
MMPYLISSDSFSMAPLKEMGKSAVITARCLQLPISQEKSRTKKGNINGR